MLLGKKNKSLLLLLSFLLCSNITFAQNIEEEDIEIDIYEYDTDANVKPNQSNHKKKRKVQKETWYDRYSQFKSDFQKNTGISYSLDASILGQRGAPNGKGTSWQFQFYPSISWEIYNGEYGTGTINSAYTPTRYWSSTSAQDITNNINVLSEINDYTTKSNTFDELSYTHQFAGNLSWLSFTVGQFPIYNFDGSEYLSNQQINFINYALSQNATSSYPTASLGAYFTFTMNPEWQLTLGMQDAHNVNGTSISSSDFGKGKYTSFVSLSYTPTFLNLGDAQYSLLIFNQPSVVEQPQTSNGFSFNWEQSLGDTYAIFGRISGVKNSPEQINQTYVLGGVVNNPLGRNALDQIGFATALNKANKDVVGDTARKYETVLETYWAWGIGNYLTITPDIQFYIKPALDRNQNTATVASIRTTFMF